MEQNDIPQCRKSERKYAVTGGALALARLMVASGGFSFCLFGDQYNISVPSFSLASRELSSSQHESH